MSFKSGLIACFVCIGIAQSGLLAQETVAVSGNIFDAATGLSLPGVQIRELKSTNIVLSDECGNYWIDLNLGEAALLFHHPDYVSQTQKKQLTGNKEVTLDVRLEEDLLGLSEIVTPVYTERDNATLPAISVKTIDGSQYNTLELFQLQKIFEEVFPGYLF